MTEPDPSADRELRVRPYALTRGRTRPVAEVSVETMILTTDYGRRTAEECSPEERRILEQAAHPVSVAEIAARVNLILGVARVIVGDLLVAGRVSARHGITTDRPDAQLLERVLNGLKSL